jgi:hypothetical protein
VFKVVGTDFGTRSKVLKDKNSIIKTFDLVIISQFLSPFKQEKFHPNNLWMATIFHLLEN